MTYNVTVTIRPKEGLRDPEGATIAEALEALGHDNVSKVRVGRQINVALDANDEAQARESVETMCQTILANPVIEDYTIAVRGDQ